jgi:hypothetical protein
MGYFSSAAARSMARRGGVGRPRAKRPYKRMPARRPATRKKGRTGTKRRSAGGGAMQRHSAPVAVGTSVSNGRRGPGGIGYSMRQVSDTCTRIIGRAYVGEVNTANKISTAGGLKANCLGLAFDINPSLLNDRVAVIASTFQKYVYQGVKFTYVPQCSTATPGSVGLVFDRDPLEISANTQGDQFLSEVMSYEHAVLTPAYVGASTAYTRDPKELKTWYLGAPDATLTTRETSQGNLLVYLSNAAAPNANTGFNGGYGFIVMDYVLDLIAPTLLPNKQNITTIKGAPSQWVDCTAVDTINPTDPLMINPSGANTYDLWNIPAWMNNFTTASTAVSAIRPGVVGEIHLGGATAAGGQGNLLPTTPGGSKVTFADGATIGVNTFKYGQKAYFCIHSSVPTGGNVYVNLVSWHSTLSSARAAASEARGNLARPAVFPDAILGVQNGVNYPSLTIGGWARLIAEGCGSEDNA